MSQQSTQPRTWTVHLEDDFDDFRERAARAFIECESIGDKIGGKFYIVPQREQGEDGLWYTTAWHFMWDSFVPGKRKPAQAKAAEPVAEPELEVEELIEDEEQVAA